MKRLFIPTILILTLILAACSGLPTSSPTPLPTVSLDPVSQGESSTDGLTASGIIVPLREAQLSFPAVGRVKTVEVKVGDKVTAGQIIVTLDTALLEARVREAQANWDVADIQLRFLKRVGTAEQNLESAEADLERAQALLDSARAALEAQSALTAPFDATVVAVDTVAGETVVPGRVVVTLGDLSRFRIETTDLSELDVTRVKIGQTAKVFIEALNEEIEGKVVDIALFSSTLGGDVVFTVTIELGKQPQGLRWGMSADVTIETK
ncbi:MAG: HlyD family efflux transporter periplasmic adaptor subunit [Anaerolineaceae bacterium]|nr:MAG: HlyD family efflux transporter periplasmic adaptor subunit [Anaerolineaceae bacterium]